jgi:hypothetical protein
MVAVVFLEEECVLPWDARQQRRTRGCGVGVSETRRSGTPEEMPINANTNETETRMPNAKL